MEGPALDEIPDDEWDYDFDNNRPFLVVRWEATQEQCRRIYSSADYRQVQNYSNPGKLGQYLRRCETEHCPDVLQKNKVLEVQEAVSTYKQLADRISGAIHPESLDLAIVWGPIALVIRSSLSAQECLESIAEVLSKARRLMERILRCVIRYQDEQKEARLAMVDSMGALALILASTMRFIYQNPNDMARWREFERTQVDPNLTKMNAIVQHLHELAATSIRTDQLQAEYVSRRNAGITFAEEPDIFPCNNLPFRRNEKFYGRERTIKAIDEYLRPEVNKILRTYTIYGRRGVGKTNIALEYAHVNPSKFDAIFWIGCETAASLRIAFTQMALKLKLGGATATTHHDENLMLVHNWLKRTEKLWLLIFDNAEDDDLLRKYWPDSKGAIIITSRQYVNFSNHALRGGETIQPFNFEDGWALFSNLVGWTTRVERDEIPKDEIEAARSLIREFEGVPLSLNQAALLVESRSFPSVKALLEEYWKVKTIVAPRPTHTHSSTNHAVDTIWYFSFQNLSENAKAILSVLCLLSPDVTFLDIFLPQNQETLTSFLAFCRREAGSGANQSPQMRDAIEELLKSTLIRREARILSVHRVVQEAFFYVNRKERREAFRSAVKLVHNAFPKQINGRPLHHVWDRCDRYIQDAIFLATRYKDFQKINDPISAPSELCPLLMNAAWYLHEVSDHTENFKLLNIAYEVCGNEISLEYAHLRNTAGAIYFELNDLHSCRAAWEEALRIRSAQLDDRSEELANSINNLANLSVAEGSYELALEGFARAYEIRTNLGEELQLPLAITLIGRGRALLALGRYGEAAEANEEAQGLILSSGVPRTPFRADVLYAQGNLARAQNNLQEAKSHYEAALRVLLEVTPTNILVSCSHYKIACVDLTMSNIDWAKQHLNQAFTLADLYRRGVDDGNLARFLWKRAEILERETPFGGPVAQQWTQEAIETKDKAEQMRMNIERANGLKTPFTKEGKITEEITEETYNDLVCGYFR